MVGGVQSLQGQGHPVSKVGAEARERRREEDGHRPTIVGCHAASGMRWELEFVEGDACGQDNGIAKRRAGVLSAENGAVHETVEGECLTEDRRHAGHGQQAVEKAPLKRRAQIPPPVSSR